MSILRLIVKNNPTGIPTFELHSPHPLPAYPPTSRYTIHPIHSAPPSIDLSRTLNTRHLRQADVRYRLVLAASPSAGHGADEARGRRVWIKIYEVDEWLGSQGWDLLGSHVEAYVDAPTEAGRGGCGDGDGDGHGEEGRQDKGICDVHTYVRGMDRRWKTGGV